MRLIDNILFYLTLLYFTLLYCVQGYLALRTTWRKVRGHMTTRTTDNIGAPRGRDREENLPGTETKAAFKTTELVVYVLAVLGVLIASMIVDQSFGADPAWRYVTYLTVGYLISRGLAKSGSRNPRAEGE